MPKLLENFTIEIGDTIEKEIGVITPNTSHVWDTTIPVTNTTDLNIETRVSNNIIYEYKTEVKIYYTDPTEIIEPDAEGNVANNASLAVTAILSHHKGANTVQLVLDAFPQYFTRG
jgi:hypothetical protein